MLREFDKRITEIRNIREEIRQLLKIEKEETNQDNCRESAPTQFFPLRAKTLKELKVAAIMDRFTLECFRPECALTELTPDHWRQEMETAAPDLLFIESAWEGKDKLWHGKVNHCSAEVYELTEYCHAHKIPVIFWNKEDPGFTDTFMTTARRADAVFTTDLECIEKYKTELGHDKVYHLHFAAQPCVHNPIEKYERKDRFCFAGAYYHRYQDRCHTFDSFSDYFIQSRGFDIYDRNYPDPRPEHKFPEQYDPYILGRLDPSEIDRAYKGYIFGVNMNSSPQSQTMFARRVFELMASNTIVIGNYSRGVKNYFGDLTFCTDDEKTLRTGLERYCSDQASTDKLRLLALRKVLSEHLCEDRLDYIVQKIYGCSLKRKLPAICVCARAAGQKEAERILCMFERQNYMEKRLLLVCDQQITVPDTVVVMTETDFDTASVSKLFPQEFFAYFSEQDWYGENYLLDLALATRYGAFDVIGKSEYFSAVNGKAVRQGNGQAYHMVRALPARRSIVRRERIVSLTGAELSADRNWQGERALSVDTLNYCEAWAKDECAAAEDMVLADQGIPLEKIERAAEKIQALLPSLDRYKVEAEQIAQMKIGRNDPVHVEQQGKRVLLTSELPEDVHRYFNLNEKIEIGPLLQDGTLDIVFHGEGNMNLMGCCLFYDAGDKKLDAKTPRIGRREKLTPPPETAYMRLAYRVRGAGTAALYDVEIGAAGFNSIRGGCFLSRSNVLILTNHYPAPDDFYRNMFVHKRVTAYKEQGYVVDVMRMHPYAKDKLREFEGINIIEGHNDMLTSILSNGAIDTVCVHFLDQDMWEVLKPFLGSIRLIVWSHGADIQPWWRRTFNYKTEKELESAKTQSDQTMQLWNEVFEAARDENIYFVFVSQYFAQEIMEDYHRKLPPEKYTIIHNLIDTDLFQYYKKNAEQRKLILTIKPFSSSKYGNDMTTNAILELSKKPFFSELQFSIYGDGENFERDNAPLRKFKNVNLFRTFLSQSEIAALHRKNGVFIATTRWDSHGVSRDEAMSSGLVPITNAVAAIPEFVDESCGILAPGEDYMEIANGIERLYYDPDLFLELSKNAAKRVRHQTSREYTIDKELQLLFPGYFSRIENGFLTIKRPVSEGGSA